MTQTAAQRANALKRLIDATHKHASQLLAQARALRVLNARRRAALAALQGPPPSPHKGAKHRFGLDYVSLNPAAVRGSGATFACRYLSLDRSKNLTLAEAKQLARYAIDKVVVWETTANRATAGQAAGAQDARTAQAQAQACGMPHGRPIYFAVDFDANGPEVDAYFDGVKSVLGLARTGCYGGVKVIRHLFATHRITYGWQTYAWSGGQWDPHAQLQQYDNSNNAYDKDRTVAADFGQWR